MNCKEELGKLVREGPVADIFRAEQALSILSATGNEEEKIAEKINQKTYGEFFGLFQSFCLDQFVLSVSKLYEKQKGYYPLRNIPSILEYIKNNANHLKIAEPFLLKKQLTRLGIGIEVNMDEELDTTNLIYKQLFQRLPRANKDKTLIALKALRDKKIAHPENIDSDTLPKTQWEQAEKLLQYPKDVVGVIGEGYLGCAYMSDDDEYTLSSDANRVGRYAKRLLKEIGIK